MPCVARINRVRIHKFPQEIELARITASLRKSTMNQLLLISLLGATVFLGAPSIVFAAAPDAGATDLAITKSGNQTKLSDEQLAKLLDQRVPAGLGLPFGRLQKMSLVGNKENAGRPLALVTGSEKIAKTMLRSNYPGFYKPTLREFFDSIAWQSFSNWKYDPGNKYVDDKSKDKKSNSLVAFEFFEEKRRKPYEVNLASGWSTKDNGNWVMCTPPGATVGMDIYEIGKFSSINKSNEAELYKQVPYEVSMEWAQRVKPGAKKSELKPAKVGEFDALHFESMVKTQDKKSVHWRQWVFMGGNECFFIVSTIYPESESKVLPEVEAMLKTFKLRK